MTNVLIRDVPEDDLDRIRSAAAAKGTSVQTYLRDAVHMQATYLRRQEALARTAGRLSGRAEVSAGERSAVLDAIESANADRAEELSQRPTP